MAQYKLQASKGTTPPRYVHTDYNSSVAHAKDLSERFDDKIEILEIVAVVVRKPVPVTRIESVVIDKRNEDELPF